MRKKKMVNGASHRPLSCAHACQGKALDDTAHTPEGFVGDLVRAFTCAIEFQSLESCRLILTLGNPQQLWSVEK